MGKIMDSKEEKEALDPLLKSFDLDFDRVKIELPDESYLEISISEQLLINKDLPSDILGKMACCAANYARWGVVESDLNTYHSLLSDRYSIFLAKGKTKARELIGGKPSETKVEEAAILDNLEEYKKYRKQFHKTERATNIIKRIMKALEMSSDMCRSIASYNKRELEMTDRDSIIGKGTLSSSKNNQ